MPRQDAQGRWISDDGQFWWDGAAWRPMAPVGPAVFARPRSSQTPYYIGIGCAVALLLLIGMGVCTTLLIKSPSFQQGYNQGYCQQWAKDHPGTPCPIATPSP